MRVVNLYGGFLADLFDLAVLGFPLSTICGVDVVSECRELPGVLGVESVELNGEVLIEGPNDVVVVCNLGVGIIGVGGGIGGWCS